MTSELHTPMVCVVSKDYDNVIIFVNNSRWRYRTHGYPCANCRESPH